MMGGMFGGGNRDQTCETCWAELPFGYKFLFLFTLIYNALTMFLPFLATYVYMDAYAVIYEWQFYRLLFPYFLGGSFPMSIINILINFLWMLSILPPLEKQLSTTYILVEVFLQNFLINFTLVILGLIGYFIFGMSPESLPLISFGFFPMVMIFIWYRAAQNPQQHTTFCCMPCLIPMKWIPFILLAFVMIFASMLIFALVIAFILGYIQFMHLKRRLIRLPLSVYRKMDMCLPKSLTNRPDFIKVSACEANLRFQCSGIASAGGQFGGGSGGSAANRNQPQVSEQPNKVEVMGRGVNIGGGSSSNQVNNQDFRGFWAKKAQDLEVEPSEPYAPQEGEKKVSNVFGNQVSTGKHETPQSNNPVDPNYFNQSDAGFNHHNNDETDEELQERTEKKVEKENLLD